MEENRKPRYTRQGVVVSASMDKTVVVNVPYLVKNKQFGKVVRKSKKFKAHDENNECGVGDTVIIMETRPLSKDKYHRVIKIVKKAD